MLHPLFTTIVKRPDLVVDHISAYAALFHQEASAAGSELLKRVIAWGVAAVCGMVFLGMTGTALMLGFMQNQFHWVLVLVPGVALVFMAVAVMLAVKPLSSERFPELKAQVDADAHALRAAS